MTVIMFQPRFAPKVVDGTKPHTIRPERTRPIRVGDHLSLRRWADKPYRSKQIVLRETVCDRIQSVRVCFSSTGRPFVLAGVVLMPDAATKLAVADGFADSFEMMSWFHLTHGLPFHGVMIGWTP